MEAFDHADPGGTGSAAPESLIDALLSTSTDPDCVSELFSHLPPGSVLSVRREAWEAAVAALQTPRRALADCAVSLRWVREEFWPRVVADKGTDWAEKATTLQVVTDIITPATLDRRCRYVDIMPPGTVGASELFISHRWGAPFRGLLDALRGHLCDESENVFVWLDIFAVVQHVGSLQVADLSELASVIAKTRGTVLHLEPNGLTLTRIWCLFEIWQTIKLEDGSGRLQVIAPGVGIEDIRRASRNANAANATATVPADRDRILAAIEDDIGAETLATAIRNALVESQRRAAAIARAQGASPLELAQSLEAEGHALGNMARFAEAIERGEEALALRLGVQGRDNPHVAKLHGALGAAFDKLGRCSEAEEHYLEMLSIMRKLMGSDALMVASSLSLLANLYSKMDRGEDALTQHNEALRVMRLHMDEDDVRLAGLYGDLATLHCTRGRHSEALEMFQKARRIIETSEDPDNLILSAVLSNTAQLHQKMNNLPDALEACDESLRITKFHYGERHTEVQLTMSVLADIRKELGDLDIALQLYKDSASMIAEFLGNDHARMVTELKEVADVCEQLGRFDECITALDEAISILLRTEGPTHAHTRGVRRVKAAMLRKMGDSAGAEAILRELDEK